MEDEECLCSSLNWEFYHHQQGLEDLRNSIMQTSLELEATIMSAKEEIRRRESEMMKLKEVLSNVMKERDEFEAKYQKLVLKKEEKLQYYYYDEQEYLSQNSGCHNNNNNNYKQHYSSSSSEAINSASNCSDLDCDELLAEIIEKKKKKGLPEKGKLLKAVMEAGPLLKTLLLAGGPLPQWHHPPPQLHSIHIPQFSHF